MNFTTRTTALMVGALLSAPLAMAQDFQQLEIVRTDPPGAENRRQVSLVIRGSDGHIDGTAERSVIKEGQPAWETNVYASAALTRKRLGEMSQQVREALAAQPSGNLSRSLTREAAAKARRDRVSIDGVQFDVYGGQIDDAGVKAALAPLLANLDGLFEKHLPPPAFYGKIRYKRPGQPTRTLEVSPTGSCGIETEGAAYQFKTLSDGPLKKIDALARAAGPFTAANKGKTVAIPTGAAAGEGAFELELELLGGGPAIKLTGTVGSYAASAAKTGELVDYLESTLARSVRANGGGAGINGALDNH